MTCSPSWTYQCWLCEIRLCAFAHLPIERLITNHHYYCLLTNNTSENKEIMDRECRFCDRAPCIRRFYSRRISEEIRNDVFSFLELNEAKSSVPTNKNLRFASYRFVYRTMHANRLDSSRIKLPSCVEAMIKRKFSEANRDNYVGFKPTRNYSVDK